MTSCVHKMCELTYGQTNMKRAITLAKVNHPWNRYNMRMLRSWSTKIPNINKNPTKDKWLVTYTWFRDGQTNGWTRVFQYTHHSVSGGIIKVLTNCTWNSLHFCKTFLILLINTKRYKEIGIKTWYFIITITHPSIHLYNYKMSVRVLIVWLVSSLLVLCLVLLQQVFFPLKIDDIL